MNKLPKILFRTSGGTAFGKELGMGHIYRCINLATYLKKSKLFFLIEDYGSSKEVVSQRNFKQIFTLKKNIINDENRFKRINVTKITSISDLFNKSISNVEFTLNDFDKLEKISNILEEQGNTNINIQVKDKNYKLIFNLKKKRKIDKNSLSALKNGEISTIIS